MKTSPEIAKKILNEFKDGLDIPLDGNGQIIFSKERSEEEKYMVAFLVSSGYITKNKVKGYESPKYYLSRKGQALLAVLSNEELVKKYDVELENKGFDVMRESILFNVLEGTAESLLTPSVTNKCENSSVNILEMLSFSLPKENIKEAIDMKSIDDAIDVASIHMENKENEYIYGK